jgi:phosphoribosylformimino-5-aminoimidazole carboxamide ribotide isomerase
MEKDESFRVVPVIDLMHGQVVRGVGGRRDEYRPIASVLSVDAQPINVARGLSQAGFRETYVADLDAILGAAPAWSTYAQLMRAGLELWVDAGLTSMEQASRIADFQVDGRPLAAIVAGLETLASPQCLAEMLAIVGAARLIFSLDLRAGEPLSGSIAWKNLTPQQIANLALRLGVRRMIVLDLARVGMGQGVGTEPICRELRCLDPHLQIIAGGGVRSPADLRSLASAGVDAALVASALHDGRLTPGQWAPSR